MVINGNQNEQKRAKNTTKTYKCDLCSYSTPRKSNYTRHIKSIKHKFENGNQMVTKTSKNEQKNEYQCECGKTYKYITGLSRHKRNCSNNRMTLVNNLLEETTDQIYALKNKDNTLVNEKIHEKIQENNKFWISEIEKDRKMFTELLNDVLTKVGNNNVVNSHNKTINIINYLNSECKNALNLNDFMNTIKLNLDDVEQLTSNGFNFQFENKVVKNIMKLEKINRPIHYDEINHGDFYIKEKKGWSSSNSREKIISSLEPLIKEQYKIIEEWKKMNDDWTFDKKKQEFVNTSLKRLVDIYGENTQKQIFELLKTIKLEMKQ